MLPGWWRWNRWVAVIFDDFRSPQAVGVGRTPFLAEQRCLADYDRQHPS